MPAAKPRTRRAPPNKKAAAAVSLDARLGYLMTMLMSDFPLTKMERAEICHYLDRLVSKPAERPRSQAVMYDVQLVRLLINHYGASQKAATAVVCQWIQRRTDQKAVEALQRQYRLYRAAGFPHPDLGRNALCDELALKLSGKK